MKLWRLNYATKIVCSLGAQIDNGWSQEISDRFVAHVTHTLCSKGDYFLQSITIGDETWAYHHTSESKRYSLNSFAPHSFPKIKNWKQISAKNIMGSVSWDRRGVFLVYLTFQSKTVTADIYCETLRLFDGVSKRKERHAAPACSTSMLGPILHAWRLRCSTVGNGKFRYITKCDVTTS